MRVPSLNILVFGLFLFSLTVPTDADARRGEAPRSQSTYANDVKSLRHVASQKMSRLDAAELLKEDAAQPKGVPLRISVPETLNLLVDDNAWETLPDGGRLWRHRFNAPDATDLRFGFSRFSLPTGATLHVISQDHDFYEGPFTNDDANQSGTFYPPMVPGSNAVIEVYLPKGSQDYQLELSSVYKGYRDFLGRSGGPNLAKIDFCDNDVVCPEGDPWRDEIRSVAQYNFTLPQGGFVCTGSLIMDAERSFTPYFLTAYHCMSSQSVVNTATFYWNFESPVCGQLDGGPRNQNQSGGTLRATRQDVDMTLIELAQEPDEAFNVHYAGWDRSGNTPQGSVAIHHPAGQEKVISFNNDPLTVTGSCIAASPNNTHWEVDDWEDGTTAGGSSGSGLWDPANKRIVGFLSGGAASCTVIDFDCYGRVSIAWDGANAGSRLRDWLDPNNTGITGIDGSDKILITYSGNMSMQDDTNNTGAGEVMALRLQNGDIKAQVSDANTGIRVGDLTFLSDSWTAQNVFGMPALPGSNSTGTAILATQNSDGLPIIQVKDASTGGLINNLFPWSAAWNILDTDMVPGAAGGSAALAALASRKSDGLMGVELKDPSNNSRIRLIYPLGFGWSAINLEVVNVNGQWAVATLATRDADGLAIVQVRDATSGNLVKNVFPLGLGWTPLEIKAVPDLDGNGVDEVAVRMTRDIDGLEIIQIRDSLTNNLVSNVYPIGAGGGGWSTQRFEVIDINGVTHLGILSIADSDGQILNQIKNAATAAIVRNVFFIGPPYEYLDYATLPDFNSSNASELAVLVRNTQTDLHIIQVRDASNGSLIRNVFQPQ